MGLAVASHMTSFNQSEPIIIKFVNESDRKKFMGKKWAKTLTEKQTITHGSHLSF